MDPSNNYTPGSTIAMGCSVQGYPKPNVTWIKDGLPLLPSERVQISVGKFYFFWYEKFLKDFFRIKNSRL